jgi:hypothetical protein
MSIGLRQRHILAQKLIMTPQLQQAIKLLQLSRIELAETIETVLVWDKLELENFILMSSYGFFGKLLNCNNQDLIFHISN